MIDFLQMVVSGIAVGSSYALMGLGMVLIYKSSEVPNFVQGEMALLPVFVAYMILETYGLPMYVALPGALIFSVFLASAVDSQATSRPQIKQNKMRILNCFMAQSPCA